MEPLIAAFLALVALVQPTYPMNEYPPRVQSEPPPPVVASEVPLQLSVDEPLWDVVSEFFPRQPEKAMRVVMCESRGVPTVVSPLGYHGLWQFDITTWRGVGGTGLPSEASIQEQTYRARILYDMRGWQPWPVCGKK